MKKCVLLICCLVLALLLTACDLGSLKDMALGGLGDLSMGGVQQEQPATMVPTMAPIATAPEMTMPGIIEPTEPEDETEPTDPPEEEPTTESDDSNSGGQGSAGCNHQYSDATCTSPAVCQLCGATVGAALEHNFVGGDCTTAATCSYCGAAAPGGGQHSFYGGICRACGAKNADYDKIAKALDRAERYLKYSKINFELIEIQQRRFELEKDPQIFSDVHKEVLEIHDWMQDLVKVCGDYKVLDMLTDEAKELILEMPVVPGSASTSSMRNYISKAKLYAQKASRLSVIYNVLCDDYGLPGV